MATLITTGSFVAMQGAIAEQVMLDLDLKIDDSAISQSRMVSEDAPQLELTVTATIE